MALKADITIDINKQVGNLQNLTNIYNARVGDNNTPLTVLWQKNGIALNLKGLHAFIAGKVGDGSYNSETDKVDFPVGTPVVKYEDDGSGTLDNGQSGLTTLLIPKQMWSKTGLFAGYIGLKDENGSVFTSKDIFFKVLGNVLDAGVAINYFIGDFDKALAKAEKELEDKSANFDQTTTRVLQDLHDKYLTEAQNAHDAAVAAVAELNKTREDNNNLADLIQSIENNIKANNIVTRPEYDKLANEIVNRLSQINTKPDYYDNYNDMLAANPNGTADLCVTSDTQHKWLFVNGSWLDLGEFSYADITPNLKNSLYSSDHNNVLINPDLKNDAYGWHKDPKWEPDPAHSLDNSMAYGCYVPDKLDHNQEIYQEKIPVEKRSVLSTSVQVNTNNALMAEFQLLFKDAGGNILMDQIYKKQLPVNTSNTFKTVKIENVAVPALATTCAITVAMENTGLVIVRRPQVNFEEYLLPYDKVESRKELSYNSDNALINPDLRGGAYGWHKDNGWVIDSNNIVGNSVSYAIYLTSMPAKSVAFYQKDIPVKNWKTISAGVKVNTNSALAGQLQVLFRDDSGNVIDGAVHTIAIPENTFGTFKMVKLEDLQVPANASTAAMTVVTNNTGLIVISQPQFNFEESLLPYSTKELRNQIKPDHDNVLLNPDLHESAYGWHKDPLWQIDLANYIGNSSAYGIYVKNYDGHIKEMYQMTIDVRKRRNFSAGVMVNTLNAEKAELQVLLRDANDEIIDSTVKTAPIPQNTQGSFQLVKIEDQSIPDNAVTGSIAFLMEGNGVLVVCQPQFNFEKSLLPYSTKELTQKVNIAEEKLNEKIQNIESHNLPYFVFDIDVNQVQDEWITTPFTYNNGSQTLSGYAKIAIQGDSSRAYPKKNYKIKIFSDSECKEKIKTKLKSSWTKLSDFNLKANWIDATQSRNLVNAHLMANATAVTPIKNNDVAKNLIKTQNFGQMEGFPIEVWFGDNYNGLYSCNTKKTDKVFGMDKDIKGTGVISVLDNVPAPDSQLLKVPTAKLDNVAYSDELHDTPDPELVTNWSKWLDFLNNSTDNDFHGQLANYLDINAAINIYLFGVLSREYDYMTKSVLFLTWNNGKYFYPIAYDLDSNWGQNVAGEIEGNPQDNQWGFGTETADHKDGRYISNLGWNKLFERLFKLFKPEIKAQYLRLRNSVWRNDQILNAFKEYMNQIPEVEFEKDHTLWNQIPDLDKNNYEQLHQIIIERSNQMDNWINSLNTSTANPVEPTQPAEPKQ